MVTAANISLLFIRLNIYEVIKQEKKPNKLSSLSFLCLNSTDLFIKMLCNVWS